MLIYILLDICSPFVNFMFMHGYCIISQGKHKLITLRNKVAQLPMYGLPSACVYSLFFHNYGLSVYCRSRRYDSENYCYYQKRHFEKITLWLKM